MLSPGDRIGADIRYSQGASGYGGGSNLSSPDLFAAGNNLALGWMTGLSVSPILPIIVTAFISFIVAITAALAGMEIHDSEGPSGDPPHPPKS